jgi:hypothetical protein
MIIVPEQRISRNELVEQIHKELPLEETTLVTDEITSDRLYKAPSGKAFRMIGEFSVHTDTADAPNEPTSSAAQIKKERMKMFNAFLEETDGDEAEALQRTYDEAYDHRLFSADDHIEPIHDFIGTLLCIEVFDDRDERLPYAYLSLRQAAKAQVVDDFVGINLAPESQREEIAWFSLPQSGVEWFSLQALGRFSECTIELVDHEEPEQEPVLEAEPESESKELYIPEGGVTSDDILHPRNSVLRLSLSPEEREAWKRQIMRGYREVRMPLEDDPLKDLIIIKGEHANDLEALVEAVRESQKPKKPEPEDVPF